MFSPELSFRLFSVAFEQSLKMFSPELSFRLFSVAFEQSLKIFSPELSFKTLQCSQRTEFENIQS